LLAQSVVQICQGGRRISLELQFQVTVAVNEHKSWLDVKCTELDLLGDLDQITQ
jgi:hypothetical protein